jgi:hypothetical protein
MRSLLKAEHYVDIITGSDIGLTVMVLVMTTVADCQLVQPLNQKLSHQLKILTFYRRSYRRADKMFSVLGTLLKTQIFQI